MEFANRLRSDGNDSYVARVTAYSTLGWFDDPVLSSFIQRPPEDLTAVIFHELAHQKLYVAGDSAFSEGFAVAVERESVRRWLESTGQFEVLQDVTAKWRVTDLEVRQILATQKELERIYTSGQSQEEMKNRKRSIMRQLQDTLCGIDRSCEDRTLPRAAAGDLVEINNAYLVAVDTYYSKVPAFEELLRRVHYNLPEFYRSVKEIAELPMTGREQHLRSLIQEKRDERE